ncbi:MAG: DUF2971 domain-containing protein [Chthonomonadales bacterium]
MADQSSIFTRPTHVPVLYHYCDLGGLKGMLESGNIWATNIEDLADETELRYGTDKVANEVLNESRNLIHGNIDLARVANAVRVFPSILDMMRVYEDVPSASFLNNEFYVSCFSSARDSLPGWNSFSDRGKGYAIGLKYNWVSPCSDQFKHYDPIEMVYAEAETDRVAKDISKKVIQEAKESNDKYSWVQKLGDVFTLKAVDFESEKEWRLIWTESAYSSHHYPKRTRESKVSIRNIRYVEIPLDQWELAEIISGPRADFANAKYAVSKWKGPVANDCKATKSAIRLWR